MRNSGTDGTRSTNQRRHLKLGLPIDGTGTSVNPRFVVSFPARCLCLISLGALLPQIARHIFEMLPIRTGSTWRDDPPSARHGRKAHQPPTSKFGRRLLLQEEV